MKRLITAAIVRQERQAGKKRLEYSPPDCIITPEARTVAEEVGLELVNTAAACCSAPAGPVPKPASAVPVAASPNNAAPTDKEIAAIRAAIMAQLPAGSVPESVVEQLVQKVVREQALPGGSASAGTSKSGIKVVDGKSIKMGLFEGAGKENRVGIVDVVTDADGSSMGAGFMAWENCFFPWTLTYDEIDYVIEGELHIRCNGETSVGKAGDVLFIPKNSSIEFGTPSKVKFLYVAYPANWADA